MRWLIKAAGIPFTLTALCLLAPGRATAGEAEEDPENRKLGGLLVPECDTPANVLLRQADALRAKGEYQEAIAGYQDVLRNYATSLFPLSKETFQGRAGVTYVSVSDYVEEKMGSLPEEAREVYAKNYEAAAKALLEAGEEGRDPVPLVRAARLFPIAPSGMEALGLLARWDLQSGRWPEAIARFRRVLRRDRFRWDRRIPEILSLGLALYRNRRPGDLDRLIREVGEKLDGEKGKKVAARLKALAGRVSTDRPKSFWHPRMGVNAEGTNVTSHAVGEAPKSWMAVLPPPPRQYSRMGNVFHTANNVPVGTDLERTWRPFHPSVMDDRVYVHNGIEFLCFDLLQGSEPLWRQESFYAGGRMVGRANFEPNRVYSATVSGDRLYMLMEIPALAEGLDSREYHGYVVIPPIPRRRLLALDPRTGKLLWETGANERPFTFLDHLSFCTEPLAVDGRLYLAGAFFEGIPTAFVVALDARDGSLIWKRRVCAGSQELNMFGRPIREYCGSPISAVGNALYFCSNLGAVASLRASDGEWRWVFRYAPDKKPMSRDFTTRKAAPAWVLGPVAATPERIVAAPTDCSELFGLDPESGTCRWSLFGKKDPGRRDDRKTPYSLVGVSNGKVIVHGKQVRAIHLRSGRTLWSMDFDAPSREEPAGVGALAGDRAYIPTNMALYVVNVENGERVRRVPWARPELEAGKVTVAGGFLITTTKERLNCFYDRDLLETRIKRAAAEHPKDPQAALRAARVCLRNQNLREALRFFEKARELSLPTSPVAREARHGLYLATMKLAEATRKKGEQGAAAALYRDALAYAPGKREKLETILKILDYYKLAGPDEAIVKIHRELIRDFAGFSHTFPAETSPVSADLWARFRLARHYASRRRPAAAVEEYQTVIANHAGVLFRIGLLRGPAGGLAEEAIDALIILTGRGVYKPFDEEAASLFEKGTRARDVDILGEILERFPNALVFGDTLLAIGRIQMEAGAYENAAGPLKRFLRKYPRSDKTPRALFLLFGALEKQKRYLDARRVLVRLKKSFPFAELEGVTEGPKQAGAWAGAKLKEKAFRQMHGTTLREDVAYAGGTRQWEVTLHTKPFLLPMSGTRPFEILPFVVVRVGKEVRALSVKDGEVLWTAPVERDPRRVYFAGKTLVVVESYQIIGLSPESGKRLWTRTFEKHGVVMAATVREDVLAATVRVHAGKNRDFSLVVLNADTGKDRFEPRRLGSWGGVSFPTVGEELVVGYVREARPPMIFVFDLVDGRELMAHTVKDSSDLLRCTPRLFEEERRIVYCTHEAVVALDLSGRQAWSSPVGMIDRDSLVRHGGTVILSRRDPMKGHEIMAFRVEDGEVLWRKQTGLQNIRHRDVIGNSFFVMGMTGLEVKLLRMRVDTGEELLSALVNDRPGFPPTVSLGRRIGVAKIVWRSRKRFRLESAFRIIDQETGKIVHILPLEEGTLAEDFVVVDGRLVYAQGNRVIAWGR